MTKSARGEQRSDDSLVLGSNRRHGKTKVGRAGTERVSRLLGWFWMPFYITILAHTNRCS
jgi:hypothetical protein